MKTDTWMRNFRRWSTQAFTVIAALNVLQWAPEVMGALTSSLPLWKPIMPLWAYAASQTALAVAGVVLRNIKQNLES